MRVLTFALLPFAAACATMSAPSLYTSRPLTAPDSFSANIEGPAVDAAGRLFVVNVERDGTIGLVHADGRAERFVTLPEGSTANAIQFDSRGDMLLADFTGHNVLRLDPRTRQVSVHAHSDAFTQPNDLAIRRDDLLFASDPDWTRGTGKLWRIGTDGTPVLLAEDMGTTNGIALAPDERRLYVNESVQRRIWVFDVDAVGNISNRRLFTAFQDFGLDGMKCDRDGRLYVTRYGKGTVAVVSPDGTLVRELALIGKNVSNLTFGGPDGRTVFATLQDRKWVETLRVDVPGKGW